jgi:ABC-type multidrug transport system fused ATPase/permease subunit
MKNKSKELYSMGSNVSYVLKNIWRWEKFLIFVMIFQSVTAVLLQLGSIYMPKLVIEEIIQNVVPHKMIIEVGGLVIIMAVLNFFNRFCAGANATGGVLITNQYVFLKNYKTMDYDYENIESAIGQTKQHLANDAIWGNSSGLHAIVGYIVDLASNVLGFLLYSTIISSLSPVIVVFLIITSGINYWVLRYSIIYEQKNKEKWAPIGKKIGYLKWKVAHFDSGKDIRLYGMKKWILDIYHSCIEERMQWFKKVEKVKYLSNISDSIIVLLRDGFAYVYLIVAVLNGKVSVANFILYFGIIAGFSNWISKIINAISQINRWSFYIGGVREFLDMKDTSNRLEGKTLDTTKALSIEFKNVYFKYEGTDQYILKNFNLKINAGEKVALVGENGVGKTTLTKLLCGFYKVSAGSICINGINLCEFNRDYLYTLFSAVFQDILILPFSIAKNIALCENIDINRNRVYECIQLAGLEDRVNKTQHGIDTILLKIMKKDGLELSGGEAQKLMLARALYKNAPIMLLDEPTAALDPIAENEIYMKYNQLSYEKTSIFISHRLASTRFCDKVVFINNGEVSEMGTHEELIKKGGKYAEIFEIQSHYYKENVEGEILSVC